MSERHGATSQGSNVPTRGLPTTEMTLKTASEPVTAKTTYDTDGRITAAWMPNEVSSYPDDPSIEWDYDIDEDGLWTTEVTRPLGQVSTTWVEPTRGNVVKQKGPNDKDWTHYQYDALGLLVAGWAPAQWGEADAPSMASGSPDIPTALYVYDVYADGPSLRTTPVSVISAQFVADTDPNTPAEEERFQGFDSTETTRRSYTFLDGWGRILEQHTPAADGKRYLDGEEDPEGLPGRTVTATYYNELGQTVWTSAPFFDSEPAQIASERVDPDPSSLTSYTETTYDIQGRTVAQSLSSLGESVSTTVTAYDGLTTTTTAPNGASTSATSDILGRLKTQTQYPDTAHPEATPITTAYKYVTTTSGDEAGFHTVTVTDAEAPVLSSPPTQEELEELARHQTVFVSNLAGQRVSMVDPNSGETFYTYDLNGQAISVVSDAGTIEMEYDDLGRMIGRTTIDPDEDASSSATWVYDPEGHVGALESTTAVTRIGEVDYETTTTATYDEWHRPLTLTVTLPDNPELGGLAGDDYTTSVSYDAIGQVSGTVLPAVGGLPEETVSTGYRLNGMAENLTLAGSGFTTPVVSGVEVDGSGLFQTRTYGNGVVRSIGWDTVRRAPEQISASFDYLDGETSVTEYLQLDTLSRDDAGRVTSIEDDSTGAVAGSRQCYVYDGFNRLDEAWTTADPCDEAPGTEDTFWQVGDTEYATTWSYSDTGRITSIENLAAGETSTTNTYGYTDTAHPNAVTSVAKGEATDEYTYDEAGRMVSRDGDGVSTDLTMTWDVLSNLVETDGQGGHVVYVYDASGQRVAKITLDDPDTIEEFEGTATAYLGSTEVTDPDTSESATGGYIATRYYTFGGSTVAVKEATTATTPVLSLLLGDVQGSATVMMAVTLDTGGAMEPASTSDTITRSAYMPYGAVRGDDNLDIDHGWLNQVSDEEDTGLIYLNARYYDPVLSRFVSPDPLMNPKDPRTLDPYRYADNNPISFTDASGLCSTTGNWAYVGGVLEPPCHNSDGSKWTMPTTPDENHGDSGWQLTGGSGKMPDKPLKSEFPKKVGRGVKGGGSEGSTGLDILDRYVNGNATADVYPGVIESLQEDPPGDWNSAMVSYLIVADLVDEALGDEFGTKERVYVPDAQKMTYHRLMSDWAMLNYQDDMSETQIIGYHMGKWQKGFALVDVEVGLTVLRIIGDISLVYMKAKYPDLKIIKSISDLNKLFKYTEWANALTEGGIYGTGGG